MTSVSLRIALLKQADVHCQLATAQETPEGDPHKAIEHYLTAMELLTCAVADLFQLTDARKAPPAGCDAPKAQPPRPPAFGSPLSEVYLHSVAQHKLKQYEERVRLLMEVAGDAGAYDPPAIDTFPTYSAYRYGGGHYEPPQTVRASPLDGPSQHDPVPTPKPSASAAVAVPQAPAPSASASAAAADTYAPPAWVTGGASSASAAPSQGFVPPSSPFDEAKKPPNYSSGGNAAAAEEGSSSMGMGNPHGSIGATGDMNTAAHFTTSNVVVTGGGGGDADFTGVDDGHDDDDDRPTTVQPRRTPAAPSPPLKEEGSAAEEVGINTNPPHPMFGNAAASPSPTNGNSNAADGDTATIAAGGISQESILNRVGGGPLPSFGGADSVNSRMGSTRQAPDTDAEGGAPNVAFGNPSPPSPTPPNPSNTNDGSSGPMPTSVMRRFRTEGDAGDEAFEEIFSGFLANKDGGEQ